MIGFILFVLLASSPSDVHDCVIGRIAVWVMATLHPIGTGTNKREENDLVDAHQEAFRVSSKGDKQIALSRDQGPQPLPFARDLACVITFGPNGPIGSGYVAGKVGHIAVNNDRLVFRHGRLLQRWLVFRVVGGFQSAFHPLIVGGNHAAR